MERRRRYAESPKTASRRSTGHRPSGRHAPPRTRHQREQTYSHVRVEIDLGHEVIAPHRFPFVTEIRSLLRDRRFEEEASLLDLSAALLHSLQGCGYTRVDHWEVDPGGWLPLPEAIHPGLVEPVGHLLKALESDRWQDLATARAFLVRLSADGDRRADAVLRRLHREREHSLTLELWGPMQTYDVHRVVNSLREQLTVLRAQVTETTAV
ncbi:MAG TPA: hypothetical protein VML94_03460 [Thermoplasmata archaeon]|nr:hypothetical protein [Thermoplasmata archaeon]